MNFRFVEEGEWTSTDNRWVILRTFQGWEVFSHGGYVSTSADLTTAKREIRGLAAN